ncbi:MAG: methyl-accepting chemotaxis protein [Oscillospiraceae bacterium]|nr:methyl-accepting chemotaxis protein [Oscillospiraceae bacterium]
MKNLKVSAKLFVSFTIVIAFSLAIGIIGIIGMGQINSGMSNMYDHNTVPMEYLANAVEYVQRLRVQLRNGVLYAGDLERIAQVKDDVLVRENNLLEYMALYEETLDGTDNPEAIKLFNDTMTMLNNQFIPGINNILERALQGAEQHELLDEMEALNDVTNAVRDNTLTLIHLKMTDAEEANLTAEQLYTTMLMLIIVVLVIVVITSFGLVFYISGLISKPLKILTAFMNKAGSTGDITLSDEDKVVISKYAAIKDEIGGAIEGSAMFVGHVTNIANDLQLIADGDLSVDIEPLSKNDVMGNSMHLLHDKLNEMFQEITTSANQVSTGSQQVSQGAQTLAQGSTEQAASIEELSSSIAEISEKTKENAVTADKTAKLSETIKEKAEKGSQQMNEMITAVSDINEASKSIGKIIKTIDDIAFQTNILALNAAVEAARAGQHGKGFAVVAEEVRNLASKSAEAAKDTGDMIQNSINKAEFGSNIAGETAASLTEIVEGINESSQLVIEIARSSDEQSSGIAQVNIGIDQVAQVVQQNSATAQESAAASEQMSAQADVLQKLISQFKLDDSMTQYKGLPSAQKPSLPAKAPPAPHGENAHSGDFGKY